MPSMWLVDGECRLESHPFSPADFRHSMHRFGGTLLGPASFQHIETCATEVCKTFNQTEELQDCMTALHLLDDILVRDYRRKLANLKIKTISNSDDAYFPDGKVPRKS